MTESQPRVDPSDWASRRKDAMNRARELRSRIKEAEGTNQGTIDPSSLVSKSEIQRQQRSRQLEATQKLLNSQTSGINEIGFGSEVQVGKTSFDEEGQNLIERPVGSNNSSTRRGHGGRGTELIGQKLPQYQGSMSSKLSLQTNVNYFEEDFATENWEKSNRDGNNISKSMQTLSITATEDGMHSTVREMPVEVKGRGRGRGRPRPSVIDEESYRGEDRVCRQSAVVNESVDPRSKSPYSTSTLSSSSIRINDKNDDDAAIRSYLRARRVPEFKEGECEKLAILRQRLVARRQKRQTLGNERSKFRSKDGLGLLDEYSPINDDYQSGERNDPGDYSARFRMSNFTSRNNDKQEIMQTIVPEANNADDAQSHRSNVEGDPDDEASVADITLIQCDCCKRSFAPKIYDKHFDSDGTPKCAMASEKKRAVFDSAKARIANNDSLNKDEQMQALHVNKKVTKEVESKRNATSSTKRSKKGSKWREQSQQFREAMRATRLGSQPDQKGRKK